MNPDKFLHNMIRAAWVIWAFCALTAAIKFAYYLAR